MKSIARLIRAYRVRFKETRQPWRLRLNPHFGRLRLAGAALLGFAILLTVLWWLRPIDQGAAKASIAVLPFNNLGGDESTGRLANGITEDIITDLARFRGFEVIARNSSKVYKDNAADVRAVGRDLNVRYVLEGSIQRQGNHLRVSAQLIDATSGAHVWSDRWDRIDDDLFAIQSDIAEKVASTIGGYSGTILSADREATRRKRPGDLTAYDLYLLGLESQGRGTKADIEKAVDFYGQSLKIDPGLARAWTSLSWCYAQLVGWADRRSELNTLQLEAARRAVELDPLDAYAHAALGEAVAMRGDIAQAEIEYDRARNLSPNSADILTLYSGWASTFGRPKLGVELADKALRLNPNVPAWALTMYRDAFFNGGDYEKSLKIQNQRPRDTYNRSDFVMRAALLALLGRATEAQAALREAVAAFPRLSVEAYAGQPDFSAEDRERLVEAMRKAGFPECASKADFEDSPDLVRLPNCSTFDVKG